MAHAASQLKKKADENLNAAEEEKEKERKKARKRSREVKKKVEKEGGGEGREGKDEEFERQPDEGKEWGSNGGMRAQSCHGGEAEGIETCRSRGVSEVLYCHDAASSRTHTHTYTCTYTPSGVRGVVPLGILREGGGRVKKAEKDG